MRLRLPSLATRPSSTNPPDPAGSTRQPARRVPRPLDSRLTAVPRSGILDAMRSVEARRPPVEACSPRVGRLRGWRREALISSIVLRRLPGRTYGKGGQMTDRWDAFVTLVAFVLLIPLSAAGQHVPRTPFGAPDLQGVWTGSSVTPLERPRELADREFLSDEEAANLEQQALDREIRLWNRPAKRTEAGGNVDRGPDGAPGFYNNRFLTRMYARFGAMAGPPCSDRGCGCNSLLSGSHRLYE